MSKDLHEIGPFAFVDDEPVYVLERQPYKENESRYAIWVKEDCLKISPVELSKLLTNVLRSQVKEPTT